MMVSLVYVFVIGSLLPLVTDAQGNGQTCCVYCRAEQSLWTAHSSGFQLSADADETAMTSPPARLVEDEEEVSFLVSGRTYRLAYAGSPVRLQHETLNDANAVQTYQFIQADLAEPKHIGGLLTQGGYYEEKVQNLYPRKETWVTRFAVSVSNNSRDFFWVTDERGNIEEYDGNTDAVTSSLLTFDIPHLARYVRYHPLRGQDDTGAVTNVNVRVSVIACSAASCAYPKINCLMTEWSEWSTCECGSSCQQSRDRRVIRVQACGGERCGDTSEMTTCSPEAPAWQSAVLYVGVSLGVLIAILVIALVAYKMTHRDRVEVIVVRENDDDDDDDDDDLPPRPAPGPGGAPFMGPRPGFPGIRPGFGPNMGPRPRFAGPPGPGPTRFSGTAGGVAPVQQ